MKARTDLLCVQGRSSSTHEPAAAMRVIGSSDGLTPRVSIQSAVRRVVPRVMLFAVVGLGLTGCDVDLNTDDVQSLFDSAGESADAGGVDGADGGSNSQTATLVVSEPAVGFVSDQVVEFRGKLVGTNMPIQSVTVHGQEAWLNGAFEFEFVELFDPGQLVVSVVATLADGSVVATTVDLVVEASGGAQAVVFPSTPEVGESVHVACASDSDLSVFPIEAVHVHWSPSTAFTDDGPGRIVAREEGPATVYCDYGPAIDTVGTDVVVSLGEPIALSLNHVAGSTVSVGTHIDVACVEEYADGARDELIDDEYNIRVTPSGAADLAPGYVIPRVPGQIELTCRSGRLESPPSTISVVPGPEVAAVIQVESTSTGEDTTDSIFRVDLIGVDVNGVDVVAPTLAIPRLERQGSSGDWEVVPTGSSSAAGADAYWLTPSEESTLGLETGRRHLRILVPGEYRLTPVTPPGGSGGEGVAIGDPNPVRIGDVTGVPSCLIPLHASWVSAQEGDDVLFQHQVPTSLFDLETVEVVANGVVLARSTTETSWAELDASEFALTPSPIDPSFTFILGRVPAAVGVNTLDVWYVETDAASEPVRRSNFLCSFYASPALVDVTEMNHEAASLRINETAVSNQLEGTDSMREVITRIWDRGLADRLAAEVGESDAISNVDWIGQLQLQVQPIPGVGLKYQVDAALDRLDLRVRFRLGKERRGLPMTVDVAINNPRFASELVVYADAGVVILRADRTEMDQSGIDVDVTGRAGSRLAGALFAFVDEAGIVREYSKEALATLASSINETLAVEAARLESYVDVGEIVVPPISTLWSDSGVLPTIPGAFRLLVEVESAQLEAQGFMRVQLGMRHQSDRHRSRNDLMGGAMLPAADYRVGVTPTTTGSVGAMVSVGALNQFLHTLWRNGWMAPITANGRAIAGPIADSVGSDGLSMTAVTGVFTAACCEEVRDWFGACLPVGAGPQCDDIPPAGTVTAECRPIASIPVEWITETVTTCGTIEIDLASPPQVSRYNAADGVVTLELVDVSLRLDIDAARLSGPIETLVSGIGFPVRLRMSGEVALPIAVNADGSGFEIGVPSVEIAGVSSGNWGRWERLLIFMGALPSSAAGSAPAEETKLLLESIIAPYAATMIGSVGMLPNPRIPLTGILEEFDAAGFVALECADLMEVAAPGGGALGVESVLELVEEESEAIP